MSQPVTHPPVSVEHLRGIRARYAKGVEDLAAKIEALKADHRATIGAVAALDKIIEEATAIQPPSGPHHDLSVALPEAK